jgi:hypothetical protein
MNWMTATNIIPSQTKFGYTDKVVCLGSCFAQTIGERLENLLYDCSINPLGTVYNPIAIAELINRAVENAFFESGEFFEHQELWRHFLVQDKFASTNIQGSLDRSNEGLSQIQERLLNSSLFIITLGSAWIYEPIDQCAVVAHNHKLPLSSFRKGLLEPSQIVSALLSVIAKLQKFNPEIKVCLTVSPVRHVRDGLHENNLSKSSLLLAANQLTEQCEGVNYFPAYEILIDELRDYRFYAEDLAHPSETAVDYIWQAFQRAYFSDDAISVAEKIEKIRNSLAHRPNHVDTASYQNFKSDLREKIVSLESEQVAIGSLMDLWEQLP